MKGTRGPSGTLAQDRSVWQLADSREAQATAEGRFLVFPSSEDLTAGDESKVPQLFEYNAGDESLTRVSIGQGGTYSDDGNVEHVQRSGAYPHADVYRRRPADGGAFGSAVSEDGSKVFFTSAARLAPQAEGRARKNVYEYREGNVYLVSDGQDSLAEAENLRPCNSSGSDSSGKDAFFFTADALVPQDVETHVALYDAREEGGFPAPALAPGCSRRNMPRRNGGNAPAAAAREREPGRRRQPAAPRSNRNPRPNPKRSL